MKREFRVEITASAEDDLAGIWDYIAQDSPNNAAAFIAELERKIESLCQFPERAPIIPESLLLQTRSYRHLVHKNYRIVFRTEGNAVYVLRIFHGSRLLDLAALDK